MFMFRIELALLVKVCLVQMVSICASLWLLTLLWMSCRCTGIVCCVAVSYMKTELQVGMCTAFFIAWMQHFFVVHLAYVEARKMGLYFHHFASLAGSLSLLGLFTYWGKCFYRRPQVEASSFTKRFCSNQMWLFNIRTYLVLNKYSNALCYCTQLYPLF